MHFSNISYTSAGLQSHSTQDGSDVIVMLNDGNALRIANTTVGGLQSSWFDLS